MQEISWYIPGYVLYAYHAGSLNQEELEEADRTVIEFLRDNPHQQVILVSDHRHVVENKVPVYKMANMLNFAKEPNLASVVSLQNNNALVFMGKIFTQIMGLKYQFANSLDEGLAFLQQQYPDIPWHESEDSVLSRHRTANV